MSLEIYSKLSFIQQFVKTLLNSITLLVSSAKSSTNVNGISKQQDEYAYFKMIEHIIKFSL